MSICMQVIVLEFEQYVTSKVQTLFIDLNVLSMDETGKTENYSWFSVKY